MDNDARLFCEHAWVCDEVRDNSGENAFGIFEVRPEVRTETSRLEQATPRGLSYSIL